MNAKSRLTVLMVVMLGLLFGVQFSANAFFPSGMFDEYGKLLFYKWSYAMMEDTNNDGDISGPDEGVEIMLEAGPLGFTDEELDIVKEAFGVWQDVPTAYVGFQFSGPTYDIHAPTAFDLMNFVGIVPPGDPQSLLLPSGLISQTIRTVAEAQFVYVTGTSVGFYTTQGQILDVDVLIDGAAVRPAAPGTKPEYDLKAVLVQEVGRFIGLEYTPLNNLTYGLVDGSVQLIESPVLALRDGSGLLQTVGATPTMFPTYFFTENGDGDADPGFTTLAPDDIAGVSFLYPRGSQDMFFSLTHDIRSQTRPNLPSVPLPGMNIVAWCDVDNDATTPRVPLFSTISGLYERQPLIAGRFLLYNLYKELEAIGTPGMFQASYTFTSNQLLGSGLERQAPPGLTSTFFSSITGGVELEPPFGTWISETFHESGNIFDISKADLGTPLAFDRQRSTVVSLDSGKTLPTMRPADQPMFGDASQICPLTVIAGTGSLSATTPAALRAFRDNVLLRTAVGTAAVDAYYQCGPAAASYLARHPLALRITSAAAAGVEWMIMHSLALLFVAVAVMAALLYRRRRMAMFLTMALIACMSGPAQGLIRDMSDEEMVSLSDQIVTGKVTAVNYADGYHSGYNGLLTDITLEIQDVMKGGLNKSSLLQFRQIGGRNSNVRMIASDLPTFEVGEEVILYLEYRQQVGYMVVGGKRGKMLIGSDSKSGENYVTGQTAEASAAVADTAAAIAKSKAAKSGEADTAAAPAVPMTGETRITLDEYKQYIRSIVKEQKSAK